jgi:peptide/nickel transport system permease protein
MTTVTAKTTTRSGFELQKITSNFVFRRVLKALFTIWLVTTIIFVLIRLMPGNPVDILVEDLILQGKTQEEARQRAAQLLNLPLDQPIVTQYVTYLGNLLRGDLGKSYRSNGVTVSSIIAQRLPWTVFSVGLSLFISFFIGMGLGMIAAYRRNTLLDHVITNICAALDAIPPNLVAVLLILLLVITFKVMKFPQMRGAFTPGLKPGFTLKYILDVLGHWLIPGIVYILATVGSWMLVMKSSTVSVMGEDYVTVARARGLPDSRILTAYVARNARLPLFTRLALSIATVVGGSLLIEFIFTYPGIGLQLSSALYQRDYPVMQGIFLVTTIAVVFATFIADFAYGWIDPRIRVAGARNE